MLSESERALAIREGHRNAADAAYFNERPHLADDNGIRVFDAGFDRGWDAACAERDARIAEQDALIAKLRLEAQIQAQEARTANATIAEIYQAVTGGTGEPGNWNGAAPVKARIAELEQQLAEVGLKSTVDASEFSRAIDFAIDQGSEARHFLTAWREGDTADWPEFAAAIKEQT